jgi:hypothetical protein
MQSYSSALETYMDGYIHKFKIISQGEENHPKPFPRIRMFSDVLHFYEALGTEQVVTANLVCRNSLLRYRNITFQTLGLC